MLRVVGVLVLLALYISFIIDVLRTPSSEARGLPKAVWLLVVVLLPVLGGLFWFFFGRPRPAPGSRFGRRRGPMAPDDDPKFLRQVDEEAWRERMKRRRGEAAPE
jgi:hypothetical protein